MQRACGRKQPGLRNTGVSMTGAVSETEGSRRQGGRSGQGRPWRTSQAVVGKLGFTLSGSH